MAVLSDAQVVEMLTLRRDGWTISALAERFGASWWTVHSICARRRRRYAGQSKHATKKPPEGGLSEG